MRKKLAMAVAGASLLTASFLLDGKAAAAMKSIQTESLTLAVNAFNRHYFWIYASLLVITAFLALRERKGAGRKMLVMTASILAAIAATHFLKPIIHRSRPDGMLFLDPIFRTIDYSFPSGHTSSAAAAAFSTPLLKIPWAAFATLTMFARLYSNAHFLSDVIGGIILATAASWLIRNAMKAMLTGEDMLEIRRQALHCLIGLAIAAFAWKYSFASYALIAAAAAGILLSLSIKSAAAGKNAAAKKLRSIAVAALGTVERKGELQKFPGKGAIMLFLGAGITAVVFRQEAAAAIIILAVGDSVSHLAGRLLGKARHRRIFAENKTIEGTIYGFVFAAAATALILPVWIAITAAAAAMAVEALHVKIAGRRIDDNLTVPLAAAAVLWVTKLVL